MEVRLVNNYNVTNRNNVQRNGVFAPNLSPLRHDTVSFGALKKSQFEGLDFAAVEKFKAPIEQFNSNDDLQNWCKNKIEKDYVDKDFGGRQQETQIQRKAMMKEWTDYVLKENDGYNNAAKFLIFNAITKDLKPNNDKLPPVLNKGVLAGCMDEINTNIKSDKKYLFDLNKMYQTKLNNFYLEDTSTGDVGSKWVVIPSKKHDSENFESNVDKLKALSHKNWCTKTFNAEPYLSKGDFHVYLENGQPKVGVRFDGNKIAEIQGEVNNNSIPFDYYDMVKDYIDTNNFKLSDNTKNEIKEGKKVKKQIDKVKADLADAIKNNDSEKIFDYFDCKPKKDEDGYFTLDKYDISCDIPVRAYGINEKELFKNVKKIENYLILENSDLTSLYNLEEVGGGVKLSDSKVTTLGNLKKIGKDAFFENLPLQSLGNLKYIGGDAYFNLQNRISIGNLKYIGGKLNGADFIEDLIDNIDYLNGDNIKEIKEGLSKAKTAEDIFKACGIETKVDEDGFLTISEYRQATKTFDFADFGIDEDKLLEKVKHVKGNFSLLDSSVTSLPNLETIGGEADFARHEFTSLGKLRRIGGNANFVNVEIKEEKIPNLEYIGGEAEFYRTGIKSFDALKHIGGDACFSGSRIKNVPNLEYIGGDANFDDSDIESLDSLQTIGGNADFDKSKVRNIRNLNYVGGDIYIKYSNLTKNDIKNIKRPHNKLYYILKSAFEPYPIPR